jgi:hypothetical protein
MKEWSIHMRGEDEEGNRVSVTIRGIRASTASEAGRLAKFMMHEPACWKINSVTEKPTAEQL